MLLKWRKLMTKFTCSVASISLNTQVIFQVQVKNLWSLKVFELFFIQKKRILHISALKETNKVQLAISKITFKIMMINGHCIMYFRNNIPVLTY